MFVFLLTAGAGRAWPFHGLAVSEGKDAGEPTSLVATGDFNHDGIADLIEAQRSPDDSSGAYILAVLIGQANGAFQTSAARYPIDGDPRTMVVADFNGDGNPDVIVGDGNGTLREFLGDGRGHLADRGSIARVGSVVSIAAGRFTRDGETGVAVSDLDSNTAVIFLAAHDGSLRRMWSFALPRKGDEFHLAAADFNADGISDLVITRDNDADYEVMLGNGNGTFTFAPALSHMRDPSSYCPT